MPGPPGWTSRAEPPPRTVPAAAPKRPPVAPLPRLTSLFGEDQLEVPARRSGPSGPRSSRPWRRRSPSAHAAQLAATRIQTVFGTGSPTARLMFVGEAPGAEEDRTGEPFVGRAGQLLTDMITKGMGLTRAEVYIANVLKSRPPENRNPLPDEIANCLPYLERQIAIIRPEYLCLLGATAAQALLETGVSVGRLREPLAPLSRHPDHRHLSPFLPAPQPRRQEGCLGRSADADAAHGIEATGTQEGIVTEGPAVHGGGQPPAFIADPARMSCFSGRTGSDGGRGRIRSHTESPPPGIEGIG